MSLIQMNIEEVKKKAENIRKIKNEHEIILTEMRNLILTLDEVWKGDAQTIFVTSFKLLYQIYSNLYMRLEEYAKLLDKAAKDLETVDKNLETVIRRIS